MTEETKTKVEKWIYRAAIALGVAGTVFAVYSYGKDSGYNEGYAAGYDDGHGSEGMKNAYQKGLAEASKMQAKWLYDPAVYSEEGRQISKGVAVSSRIVNNQLDIPTINYNDDYFGCKNWNARIVFVRKPDDYDDIPKFFNEDGEFVEKEEIEEVVK